MKKLLSSIILTLFAGNAFAAYIPVTPTTNIVTNEITVNEINGVQIKDSVYIYVATTGSDTTGDGTQSAPYQTIGKALAVLTTYASPSTMVITVADGTYIENIIVPAELSGRVAIYGNLTTPDNVVIEAAFGTSPVFSNTSPAKFYLDGLTLQGATSSYGIFADRGDISIFYVKLFNNKVGISGYSNAKVNLYNNIRGVVTIDGNDIALSYGIISDFNSVVNIGQNVVIDNVAYGILNRTSSLYITGNATITANSYAIMCEKQFFTYISGTQNFSSIAMTGGTGRAVFKLSQGELDMLGTINLNNAYYGFYGQTGVNIVSSATINYTDIAQKTYFDYDTVVDDTNLLYAAPLSFYAGGEKYGLDSKFVNKLDYGFYRTAVSDTDYTLTASDSIVAYTSLTATRTVTIPNALRTSVLANGMVKSFMIIDESGSAGSYPIVLDPEGATLINGATTFVVNRNGMSIHIYSNGTNWFVY